MKKVVIIISSLFILGLAITWYLFNIEFDKTQTVNADYKLSSLQLIHEFDKSNLESNKKYSDKIIEIVGEANEIEYADTSINIKMITPESSSYIIFSFQSDNMSTAKKIKKSDSVIIKGSCSGAIYSEILEANAISFKRCVIIKN
jgi:hypothetical protein